MSKNYNLSDGDESKMPFIRRSSKGFYTMSKAYTIGIIVFDGVLTSEVIGLAEVFAIASRQDWFKDTQVLLIGVEPQPTIQTEEGIRLSVDAMIADDLALDVLLVPGGNDMSL